MEEVLSAATNALSDSPQLALWVLVIIYGYKAIIVGSIYGVIRFCADKMHSAYITPKHTLEVIEIEARLRSITIDSCYEDLLAQIARIRGVKSLTGSNYIHGQDVEWLRRAIDAKLDSEKANK